jgi:PAP_fibrillin
MVLLRSVSPYLGLGLVCSFSAAFLSMPRLPAPPRHSRQEPPQGAFSATRFSAAVAATSPAAATATVAAPAVATEPLPAAATASHWKEELLETLRRVPPNVRTPESQAHDILALVRQLEASCPTPDDRVASKLEGAWELLWTGQDKSSPLSRLSPTIVNPIENQAFSNNPMTRIHPGILPKVLQRRLERAGFIADSGGDASDATIQNPTPAASIRSTQIIDLDKGKVRNVVSFGLRRFRRQRRLRPSSLFRRRPVELDDTKYNERRQAVLRASVAISIDVAPDAWDARRIHVKCQSCQFFVPGLNIDWTVPLWGVAGPMGWMRTQYVDDDLRIARGHKGTVFVLRRPS